MPKLEWSLLSSICMFFYFLKFKWEILILWFFCSPVSVKQGKNNHENDIVPFHETSSLYPNLSAVHRWGRVENALAFWHCEFGMTISGWNWGFQHFVCVICQVESFGNQQSKAFCEYLPTHEYLLSPSGIIHVSVGFTTLPLARLVYVLRKCIYKWLRNLWDRLVSYISDTLVSFEPQHKHIFEND